MTRRRFLAYTAATAGSLAAVDALIIEPSWVEFTEHTLNEERSGRQLRFVQITDLHLGSIGSTERDIATRINTIAPDVEGWYRDGLPNLYVSRGIGTTILPVRFSARPEVAVFSMKV